MTRTSFRLVLFLLGLFALFLIPDCKGHGMSAPVINSISPAAGVVGQVGDVVNLSASITTVGAVTYAWSASPALGTFSSTSVASPTFTLTGAGSCTVSLSVTDSNGTTSASVGYTINPAGPIITAITPSGGTIGKVGDVIAFNVSATGTGGLTYSWGGVGGGTWSNASIANPTLTLTSAGTFTVAISVTDTNGTTTSSVVITIDPLVPVIIAVSAPGGLPLQEQTFTVTATSQPTSWLWTFNGAAEVATSTAQNPTISLQDPGTYNVTVVATNANGSATGTATVVIDEPVVPTWTISEVGAAATTTLSGGAAYVNIATQGGKLATLHTSKDGVMFSRAKVSVPASSGDWNSYLLAAGGVLYAPHGLVSVDGRFAAIFYGGTDLDQLIFAMAQTDEPLSASDWTFYTIETRHGPDVTAVLAVDSDRLDLVYDDYGRYGRSTVSHPASLSDWSFTDMPAMARPKGMTRVGGKLYIAHLDGGPPTGGILRLTRALVTSPTGPSDWDQSDILLSTANTTASPDLAYAGGQLVVSFTQDQVADNHDASIFVSSTLTPTDPVDWTEFSLVPWNAETSGIAVVASRAVVCYYDEANRSCWIARQLRVDASNPDSWTKVPVDINGDPGLFTAACELGGAIAVAYMDRANGQLRVAISDGPF